jgi:CO/xanthine dehydrogenase Mo-binding subunit
MIDPPHPVDVTKDNPLPQGGGLRNAISLYDFPQQILTHHMVPQVPLRTSALRSLGAYLNVFAMESFMDELALDLGQDPIALRLSYLKDPRSRNLLTEVALMADWSSRDQLPEGTGLGVAFSRYKNAGAYCAVIAKIRVEEKIHVENFWCTTDVGKIINPDGLANQIEGGIIQSMSWTLKEMVTWDQQGVLSKTWDTYPILMFDEVPEVEVKLFDQVDQPSLGGGEASAGPTGAAIANALASALGIRARHLPLSAERLAQLISS